MKRLELVLVVVAGLLLIATAEATEYTYWQVGSGNWSTESNWDNGEPLAYYSAHVNNGGTVTIDHTGEQAESLYMGHMVSTNRGYVNMTGGSLTVRTYIVIGNHSDDTNGDHCKFTQTGGDVETSQGFTLGWSTSSAYGEYAISNGMLTTENVVYIGDHGTGKVVQTGGTVTVNRGIGGQFYLGRQAGGHGIYELSGTGRLVSTYQEIIAFSGSATFDQNGGTHEARMLNVGGQGTYTMNAGTLKFDDLYLNGSFVQAGGDVMDNPGGSYDGYMRLGREYSLQDGTLTINHIYMTGSDTGRRLYQTGGQLSIVDGLNDGKTEIFGGLYEIAGGTASNGNVMVGAPYYTENEGTFKVTGNDATITMDSYCQNSMGILSSVFDADGISTINISGAATLDGKFYVADPGIAAPLGRFNVLIANGGISGTYSSANVHLPSVDWSWGISGGDTLWVEHVPEPTTMGLLAIGALLGLRKRRE
ncbi:MAG: PEP-CTERM sorting domain-containing protein [Sedimentisphaerales bacterium]|nr:PEP-CTERM sorting domain-containing protein [Sedimentisphaerales bacterium]